MLLEMMGGWTVELRCSVGVLGDVGRIRFLVVSFFLVVGVRTMMMDRSCY
jgi:hypothetical protein